MSAPRIEPITSWEQFLKFVSSKPYRNWAYRGQEQADWPLLSSLGRYFSNMNVDPCHWSYREDRALRIFKRKASHFLEHIPDRDDDFQWLAIMQHHGAPTRLLDFTWSPYVAVFFALERAQGEAAVWLLKPPKSITPIRGRSFRLQNTQTTGKILGARVGYGEPYVLPRRLIAQSGTFVVPGEIGLPIDKLVPERELVKLVLPADRIRPTAMRELYRMNLTNATLFPGLDGFARSIAYELEFEWRSDLNDPGDHKVRLNRG